MKRPDPYIAIAFFSVAVIVAIVWRFDGKPVRPVVDTQGQFRVSKLPGVPVFNTKGEQLDKVAINDALQTRGEITSLVLEIDGFLAIGAKLVVLPYSEFQIVTEEKSPWIVEKVILNRTKEQLKAMDEFRYTDPH
jgi:hypothetical protein